MHGLGWKRLARFTAWIACAGCAGDLPDSTDAGSKAGAQKVNSASADSASASKPDAGADAGGGARAGRTGSSGSGGAARGAAGASGSAARAQGGATANRSTRTPTAEPGRECTPEMLYEPNDSPGDPCWLQPNQKIATELSEKDVDDYFSIDVENGVTYTFDLVTTNSHSRGLSLTVGDKVQSLIAYGYSNGGAAHIDFTPTASGRAILRMNGTTQYHFAIWDDQVSRDSSLEPNNSPASAADIVVGELIMQQLAAPEDDTDYYRFDVTADVTYTLDLTNAQSLNRTIFMTVNGAKTDLLGNAYVNPNAYHQEFKAPATGKALLGLWNNGAYHFRILGPNPEHDASTYEPNNSPSTAAPIEVGTSVLSELGAIPDDDVDCFSLPVKANTMYMLHLEHDRSMNREVTLGGQVLLKDAYLNPGNANEPIMTRGADGLMLVKLRGAANYKFDVSPQ